MNKITIKTFSSPCPTQCEGYFDEKYPFYFRERWGDWIFTLSPESVEMEKAYKRENEIFSFNGDTELDFEDEFEDEEVTEEEMMRFLEKIYEKWQEHKALPLQKKSYAILKKIAEITSEDGNNVEFSCDFGYGSGTITINGKHTHFGMHDVSSGGESYFINGLYMSLMKGKNNEENGNNKE